MWTLTVSGDFSKHELTDDQRDYYVASCKRGIELIELGDGRIFSNKMISLVRTKNEIANDPMYLEYARLGSGDKDIRRKIHIERYLDSRFPYERYIHDWNEIRGVTDTAIQPI